MPPLLALAPLAGSVVGAELLPLLGGALGGSELLGGAGLFGATLGETLGGALGGAAGGAFANKDDPLLGAGLGAVTGGLGGPGLAGGIGDLASGAASAVGLGADAASSATAGIGSGLGEAASALTPGAAAGTGVSLGGSAAATAAPEGAAAPTSAAFEGSTGGGVDLGSSFDDVFGSSLTPTGDTAGSATPGASLTGSGAFPNAASGGTVTPAPTAPTSTFDNLLSDPTWKNLGSFAGANKDLITGGLGLGMAALKGDSAFPGEDALRAQARGLGLQGRQFMTGELTPGMKSGLRSATESAKATMRSMFASRGMSGSSSEAEALASIDMTASVKGAEIAQQLIDRGINETQLSGALWQNILRASMARDEELGKAIGGFASALAH